MQSPYQLGSIPAKVLLPKFAARGVIRLEQHPRVRLVWLLIHAWLKNVILTHQAVAPSSAHTLGPSYDRVSGNFQRFLACVRPFVLSCPISRPHLVEHILSNSSTTPKSSSTIEEILLFYVMCIFVFSHSKAVSS